MSSLCSDPKIDYAVGDTLRRLSRDREQLKVTATGIARMIHAADIGMVQNALIDAASKKLLKPIIRYRCERCGSMSSHTARSGAPECLEHGEVDHDAVAIYEFTPLLHDIAQEERTPPKKAPRRRAPLLNRVVRKWLSSARSFLRIR